MAVIKLPAAGQLFEFDSEWVNDPTIAEAEDIELRTGMRYPEFVEGLLSGRTRCIAIAVWLAMYRAGYQQEDQQPAEDGSRGTHLVTFADVIEGRTDVRLNQVYKAVAALTVTGEDDKPAEELPAGPTAARGRLTDPAGSATTPASTPPSSRSSSESGRGSGAS